MTAPSRHLPPATVGTTSGRPGDTAQLPRVRIDGGPDPIARHEPEDRRSSSPLRDPRVGAALAVVCAAVGAAHLVLPPMRLGAATAVLVPVLTGLWALGAVAFVALAVAEHRYAVRARYPRMRRRAPVRPWSRRG